MKKSLGKRTMILIFTFAFILDIVSICMSYQYFVLSSHKFYYSMATAVAENCDLMIDNDSLEQYRMTKQRDKDYYEIWNKLLDYRDINQDIKKMSVIWCEKDDYVYLYDTDLSEQGAFLGDRRKYDKQQLEIEQELKSGKFNGSVQYEERDDVYLPLLSSNQVPVGYVVVGLSTEEAKKEQYIFLTRMIIILTILTMGGALLIFFRLTRRIIRPVNQLADAAANYTRTLSETDTSALQQLDIHTKDEIEHLYESMKKMEMDLLHSVSSLTVEQWNSNHDSMTKLYNKRYLGEVVETFVKGKPTAVYFCDVDNLKKMNDICGHEKGDEVICRTADFVHGYLSDTVLGFRVGGDEFILIACPIAENDAADIYKEMCENPKRNLTTEESPVQCRIAIGYAWAETGDNLDALMKKADEEMYKDKKSHR